MIEVYKGIWVGTADDYEDEVKGQKGWAVVHACKEPYHRKLIGYKGRGCPKSHPEYLYADRGDRLYLNMVDVPDKKFYSDEMIGKALDFIYQKWEVEHKDVLIHCNRGVSRSPSLALLFFVRSGILEGETLEDIIEQFKEVYPDYNPGQGILGYVEDCWSRG